MSADNIVHFHDTQAVGARGIFIRVGAIPQGDYGKAVPQWGPETEPWRGFQKLKQFADIVYTFCDCRNDQNLKISHNSLSDS